MLSLIVGISVLVLTYGLPVERTNENSGKIVGGEDADIKDYPYQVSVQQIGQHICGGSIISPKFVITAAHCILDDLGVRAGSTLRNKGGQFVNVKTATRHPKYNSKGSYDIGVLELMKELIFGPGVAAIPLPSKDDVAKTGDDATITGWGTLAESAITIPKNLQVVHVPVYDFEKCKAIYETLKLIVDETMLCAGLPEGGKDSCQGDSGGPLVIDGKLFGVVSWGKGCARKGYPGVYANVPALIDFVKETTGIS